MLNIWWMVEICGYWTTFLLISTSVVFVLISVALTEFCANFEYFTQDLTEMLLILQWIRLLSSLYLPAQCITVSQCYLYLYSWTALWLQWSHSDPWAPQLLRTQSGTITLSPLWKKPDKRLYFLHQLRRFNLPQELLIQFYSAIIESVLCTSITVWFSSATKSDHRKLRRVVRTAERIIGTTLPHSPRTVLIQSKQKGWKNHSGPSHSAHFLFELLPSGRRYRALITRTTRHRNSFFPQAILLVNTWY